ncbi:MAG TPA: hypothetical protein VJ011_12875 [Steroidobacteraceae bacterium]|nr:hypothetical protein [Steroidobacteraceae bacterium]
MAKLLAAGRVEDCTRFGPARTLTYRVKSDSAVNQPVAAFDGTVIEIRIPVRTLQEWCTNDDAITLSGVQREGGIELSIAVEKDFACLKPRAGEDESDNLPHPLAGNPGRGC